MDENEKTLMEALALQDATVPQDYVAKAKGDGSKELASREDIIKALKTVEDPEIMINIYDLGLVYSIEQNEKGDIKIDMTVTSPMCPVAGILPQQAADAVSIIKGVNEVEVKIVWEPAWTPERMSDDAKLMFDIF